MIHNSHDLVREARQTTDIRLETATKANTPEIRIELVLAFKEAQDGIRNLKVARRQGLEEK